MTRLNRFPCSLAVASILALLAPTANAQTNIFWLPGTTGPWGNVNNWVDEFGFTARNIPSAALDEIALVADGATTINSAIATDPGGVVLGDTTTLPPGTLDIQSGGVLNVVTGSSTTGSVEVGRPGIGHLIVGRGGTLTAQSLTSAGHSASSIVLGAGNAGTAAVTINGPARLSRNTRVIGPNVNFMANTLALSEGTLTAEITGPSHSALQATGAATLGGHLALDFNGVQPGAADTWDIVDANSIVGSFSSISANASLPLGHRFSVQSVAGGTHGAVARLGADVQLVLSMNRRTGATRMKNLTDNLTATIEGYGVISTDALLDDSEWQPLTQGGPWVGNGSPSHVAESTLTRSLELGPGADIDLGNIYAFQPTELGEINENIQFEYLLPDRSVSQGTVDFTGPHNDLVLVVDEAEDSVFIQNQSLQDLEIDGYGIVSESGSLDPSAWNSIASSDADWSAGPAAANHISEGNFPGSRLFGAFGASGGGGSEALNLGSIFTAGGERDLIFEFNIAGVGTLTGTVEYDDGLQTDGGLAADFDNDGDVDGDDFLLWQNDFGCTSNCAADADDDDDTDGDDFLEWQNQFGTGVGGGGLAAASVPEPATWLLAVISLLVVGMRGTSPAVQS